MKDDDQGRDAALRAADHAQAAAVSAGVAASAAAEVLGAAASVGGGAAVERSRDVARAGRTGAELVPTPEVLEGVLEDAFERGADAWGALRGRHSRRWPWAVGSALVGAAAAVAVTVVTRRLSTQDAPGAQEPEQVEAVVDLGPVATPVPPGAAADSGPVAAAVPPGAAVDEDGEAVQPA